MSAVIAALRPGDQKALDALADRWGRPSKEVAGILLEEAIRRETRPNALIDLPSAPVSGPDRKPAA